MGDRIPLK